MSYEGWRHAPFLGPERQGSADQDSFMHQVAGAMHAYGLGFLNLLDEDNYMIGIEEAARVAETAGISDVNIDCRSGSRIAAAIRALDSRGASSPNDAVPLINLFLEYQALAPTQYDSSASWFAREEMKEKIETRLWAALEASAASFL